MQPAVADRPLTVCKRPDLIVRSHQSGDRRVWRIKDALSLEYFELNEQEYAILEMLDGRVTPAEVRHRFERMFAPLRLAPRLLHDFLADLNEAGLLLVQAPGVGERLLQQHRERRRRELAGDLSNIL